jgi:signal transduction histidine kinase
MILRTHRGLDVRVAEADFHDGVKPDGDRPNDPDADSGDENHPAGETGEQRLTGQGPRPHGAPTPESHAGGEAKESGAPMPAPSTQTDSRSVPAAKRSLAGRMMAIAVGWILFLLFAGGFALDRTLTNLIEGNFDDQLTYSLTALISSAEIGAEDEVNLIRELGDQRFLEPNSGYYWLIVDEADREADILSLRSLPSRSLWDRTLTLRENPPGNDIAIYNSDQYPDEPLRIAQQTVTLPFSDSTWTFSVAASRSELDSQISTNRAILGWSFAALGIGLIGMAFLQNWFGLSPLRRVRRSLQSLRTTGANRITDPLPLEVEPLVDEINGLLAHSEQQAEEARMHAGNLAHALKTPLTVLTNAATAQAEDLAATTIREARTMQRHVDHHLARARAAGRRASGLARIKVWQSAEAVQRAVERLYPDTRFDLDGRKDAHAAIERQDLDEILGNLIENAAKYGGGSVFVTIDAERGAEQCAIWVEDDGLGIPAEERERIFDRGVRLDTDKPGTGLGLAIVRDVAEIYGGFVELSESADLGGLMVILRLPRADPHAQEL